MDKLHFFIEKLNAYILDLGLDFDADEYVDDVFDEGNKAEIRATDLGDICAAAMDVALTLKRMDENN